MDGETLLDEAMTDGGPLWRAISRSARFLAQRRSSTTARSHGASVTRGWRPPLPTLCLYGATTTRRSRTADAIGRLRPTSNAAGSRSWAQRPQRPPKQRASEFFKRQEEATIEESAGT
jgi:hypothetical protein